MQKKEGFLLLIVLYVDDLLITSSSVVGLRSIKSSLNKAFTMTDLRLLRQFIGLEVSQKTLGIMISQSIYSCDMLRIFHMEYCKSTPCPFLSGIKLEEGGSTPLVDRNLYRKLIGSLLYLTHSKARYMQEPHELHWKATKRILHYVQGTRDYGIHYTADTQLDLIGFTTLV